MIEKEIVKEFKKQNITILRLDKITNSFSSDVYIIYSKDKKYVFKILYNKEKQLNEAKYIEYLSNKINTPKLIFNGILNNKYYNVISFIEGKNYNDKDIKKLSDEQIYKVGVLLAKLHSIKPLDNDTSSWTNYLHKYADKANKNLQGIYQKNKEVYDFIDKKVEEIKGKFENVILHLDYRIGNIIFNDEEYLIDFESMKSGDPIFDFLKMYRLLSKSKFKIFIEGYKSIKKIDNELLNRIEFYNIFDAYTALNWCFERNRIDSHFYKNNIKILQNKFK